MLALQAVADRVIPAAFDRGLQRLAKRDQVFFLVWCYAAELSNGGHAQFFFNNAGDNLAATCEALTAIGLPSFGARLSEAATEIFGVIVPADLQARNELMKSLPESVDDFLSRADDAFFAEGGDDLVSQRLEAWYATHPAA